MRSYVCIQTAGLAKKQSILVLTGLVVNIGFNQSILVDESKNQIGLCKLIPKRIFLVGVSIFNL
jgi:hypothetical protein